MSSSAEHPPALVADRLTREFGGQRVVDGVDLELGAGECLALFGPNGAGKTTLLRMLAGLLTPTSGKVTVGGVAMRGGPEARGAVGLISHQSMLYAALSARENVEFTARLYGVPDPRAASDDALRRMRIADRGATPVRALSRGLQQRVSIARAIVHDPRVVLLDEPYTGLDEAGAAALSEALGSLAERGAALVLVTHNLSEGLALATQTAIMRGGHLIRREARGALEPAAYAAAYRELVGA